MSAFERLLDYPRFGGDGILERMDHLIDPLKKTGWWQKKPVIKIVGSNGKGTTAHILAKRAQMEGIQKVGLYTSPHLFDPAERIQINGEMISDKDMNTAFHQVQDRILKPEKTGRFEILTAACLYYFYDQNVDLAVMEIGLGGRLDPVKVAPGNINILTSIDLEHTAILGETRPEICYEKVSVCKAGDYLIHGEETEILPDLKDLNFIKIDDLNRTHIEKNNRLAERALGLFKGEELKPVLVEPELNGRFQVVQRNPYVIVDVAHTAEAIQDVVSRLGKGNHQLILALQADKNISRIAKVVKETELNVICFQGEQLVQKEDYEAWFPQAQIHAMSEFDQILKEFIKQVDKSDKILCLGGFEIVRKTVCFFDKTKSFETLKI